MQNIGTKFVITIAAFILLFSGYIIYSTYRNSRDYVIESENKQVELALAYSTATRNYMSDTVRPMVSERVNEDEFIPEIMSSSFAVRNIFDRMHKKFPDTILKFSSDNPRNPSNQAGPEELEIIRYFNENPSAEEWKGEIYISGKKHIAQFTPRRMKESCLRCHGDPANAPRSLLDRYGDTSGFNRPVGEVVGLNTVAVPIDSVEQRLASDVWNNSVTTAAGGLILFGLVFFVFRRMVSNRLKAMAAHFRQLSKGLDNTNISKIKVKGNDEISLLAQEFNRMAEKLAAYHESLENKVAERTEQLRREKEFSENIIETAKSFVVVLDRDATIATFNRFAEELTGYSQKEVLGKNWLEMFIPQHDWGRIRQVFQNCLDSDLPENVENPIICKSGEERTILWSNSVLRNEQGNITGTLSLGNDITESKRAEEETRLAREEAEAATLELKERIRELQESRNAMLNMVQDMDATNHALNETQAQLIHQGKMSSIGTLAAGIAHEFNNILTGMMGFASLAQMDKSKVPHLAEIVLRESERAAEITHNLLSFSRNKEQAPAPAGMRLLVEEALSLTRREFEKANITIKTDFDKTPSVMVEAGQIKQVLLNIFINARHAMEQGGSLTIKVAPEDEEVVVRVSDTGCGIPKENLAKIFDPFFSTKGVWGKDKQCGTGLGLSVSCNIIEAHNGHIEVESEVGKGATFTIRLPAAGESADVSSERFTHILKQEMKNCCRVLVADDEEILRNLLMEIITSLGHEVTVVNNGEAVLEELQKGRFDYLFLDIMMPGKYDGEVVLNKIEEMDSDVKVLICTGMVEDENLRGLLQRAHGYMRKPFTPKDVASWLGAVPDIAG